jgi:hypothetical protein
MHASLSFGDRVSELCSKHQQDGLEILWHRRHWPSLKFRVDTVIAIAAWHDEVRSGYEDTLDGRCLS